MNGGRPAVPAGGLVSVTFRRLSPEEIVALTARAGFAGIEWGGDVHAPHGDVRRAAEIGRMTRDAGLAVSAYGSYYRGDADPPFDRVLDSALALGAPLVRIWAGRAGSAAASADDRRRIADDARRAADLASAAGLRVAFEFHGGTLADTAASCARLLDAVAHPAAAAYWQPPADLSAEECGAGLQLLLPRVARVHVFHWEAGTRRPLAEGAPRWLPWLRAMRDAGSVEYASLEFVRDDAPEAFLEDAAVLKGWLRAVGEGPS